MPAITFHPSADYKSAFAEITNCFVLTSECTMVQAKTMASKLSVYKVDNVQWQDVLNNSTSQLSKQCEGPTCGPIRDLFNYHRISELKKDPTPFFEPRTVLPTWTDDFTKFLQECPNTWSCAILDHHARKVAAAANSETLAMQKVCLLALSNWLLHGPKSVILCQNHWTVPATTIQEDAMVIFDD
jgi:hypothetical protein